MRDAVRSKRKQIVRIFSRFSSFSGSRGSRPQNLENLENLANLENLENLGKLDDPSKTGQIHRASGRNHFRTIQSRFWRNAAATRWAAGPASAPGTGRA